MRGSEEKKAPLLLQDRRTVAEKLFSEESVLRCPISRSFISKFSRPKYQFVGV